MLRDHFRQAKETLSSLSFEVLINVKRVIIAYQNHVLDPILKPEITKNGESNLMLFYSTKFHRNLGDFYVCYQPPASQHDIELDEIVEWY